MAIPLCSDYGVGGGGAGSLHKNLIVYPPRPSSKNKLQFVYLHEEMGHNMTRTGWSIHISQNGTFSWGTRNNTIVRT